MGTRKPRTRASIKYHTKLTNLVKYPGRAWHATCIVYQTGMVLALCTGYPQPYPQIMGRVDIMYVIGHSLCYPMGYVQPSIVYASSKLRARLAGPPAIGAPCHPTWCGSHPPVARCKQKGPASYVNLEGCICQLMEVQLTLSI